MTVHSTYYLHTKNNASSYVNKEITLRKNTTKPTPSLRSSSVKEEKVNLERLSSYIHIILFPNLKVVVQSIIQMAVKINVKLYKNIESSMSVIPPADAESHHFLNINNQQTEITFRYYSPPKYL